MKFTADYITYMLAYRYKWGLRTHIIIPNLSWGLLSWEADLAIFTPSGYMTEVEIKCTKADLLKDRDKYRWNTGTPQYQRFKRCVKEFYYAVPEHLVQEVPEDYKARAGIISVPADITKECECVHGFPLNNKAKQFSDKDMQNLYRLLSMRFWREFSNRVKNNCALGGVA